MAAPKLSFVNIGVSPDHKLIPDEMREPLKKAIADSKSQMEDAGYDIVTLPVNPDVRENVITELVKALKEKERAGVIIGGGFKKMPQLVAHLEDIIYTTHEVSPKTQILFVDLPGEVVQAAKRCRYVPS